jgi:hypothetical protein
MDKKVTERRGDDSGIPTPITPNEILLALATYYAPEGATKTKIEIWKQHFYLVDAILSSYMVVPDEGKQSNWRRYILSREKGRGFNYSLDHSFAGTKYKVYRTGRYDLNKIQDKLPPRIVPQQYVDHLAKVLNKENRRDQPDVNKRFVYEVREGGILEVFAS